jgi:hypothetical protein
MKWITREKVKVGRVARPWRIRKFIDPEAKFIVWDALYAECERRAGPAAIR